MLFNCINWVYIMATTFLLGFAFDRLSRKALGYSIKTGDGLLVAGLTMATVYAEVWSLFGGVGIEAGIVLLAGCVLIAFFGRKELARRLDEMSRRTTPGKILVILGLFVMWSYFASRGYMAYDSDLYHGQSIRWIEEYGVVKGLGNLHERFAYNSSAFALSALYSMKYLFGISMHGMSGFWAWVLSISLLPVVKCWKRGKLMLSDMARMAGIYYLTTICDEVVAPASDFAIMCLLFWIVIKWLDLLEEKAQLAPFALLCVAGAYGVTLKLTAGLILILLIGPAKQLIKEKKGKQIALYLAMGLAVVIPWVVRTVLISGYLVYPLPELDLFTVDWKMHPQVVEVDAANIKVWARGMYETSLIHTPVSQWLPGWFKTQLTGTEKLLILGDGAGLLLGAGFLLYSVIRKKWENMEVLTVLLAVQASYLFWQFSAPMVRYGYAYVLLAAALPLGVLVTKIPWQKVIIIGCLLFGVYKMWMVGNEAWNSRGGYMIRPEDYGTYELETYLVNDMTFFYNPTGDRVGYEAFPAGPSPAPIEFRGDSIREGFRRVSE